METNTDKTLKKRKSLASQNSTPSKVKKAQDGSPKAVTPKVKTPKLSEKSSKSSPLLDTSVGIKNKKPKTSLSNSVLEKSTKGESSVDGTTKLKKFKGVTSLEEKAKKRRPYKSTMMEKVKEKSSKEGQEAVIKSLNKRIDEILSRAEVTKTAKRKVKVFKTLIKALTGEQSEDSTPAKKVGKPSKKVKTAEKVQEVKPKQKKEKQKKKVEAEDDDDDSESEEVEEDLGDLDEGEENDDQSSVAEEEEDENDDDDDDEEEEDEDSEEEVPQTTNKTKSNKAKVPQPKKALIEMEAEEDDDEEGTDSEEEEEEEELKMTKPQKSNENVKKPVVSNGDSSKKTRYVLFVGNLAYNTTKAELEEHFKKAGNVVDVRIPTDRTTSKPRGFAYVELADKDGYENAIGLNDTQLKNRKIHVEYTQTGKKDNLDKKAIKAKTFKLQAMQKKGQFNRGFNKQNKK